MTLDEYGRSPLMAAVVDRDEGSLRRLLTEGADVNEATPVKAGFLGGSTGGFTALHLAASTGNEVAIPLLIQHGANREAKEAASRMTPLLLAAFSRKEESIIALVGCNVDIHTRDSFGNTALHFCVEAKLNRAATALVEAGAIPSKADLDRATADGNHEMFAILQAGEARRAEEELAKKRAQDEEKKRRQEEEERRANVQATRKSSGQCVMCGQKLKFGEKLFGKDSHGGCRTFRE